MKWPEWEPVYTRILQDMGFSREGDESSVRVLKAVTMNSDLVDPDEERGRFSRDCTVFGDAPRLDSDLDSTQPVGTRICSGSAVVRLLARGILPDVVVTDLDGDMDAQLEASSRGALTFIHAHGDNADLIREYAGRFRGPVVLTTQSVPENTVFNFGGFTDGDRAVCVAQEMGACSVLLMGFDYTRPNPKDGSDPDVKLRKLAWAREIIDMTGMDIVRP